jgi:dTDP-4-amino-4,6-dideoxygalactose transaminase
MKIPFNKPFMTGKELFYIAEAHFNGMWAEDGPFTKMCHAWLVKETEPQKAFLTHFFCTAAL